MSTIDETLAALADPTRRSVVDLLRRGPRRSSDLAASLDVGRPAMSRHLGVLRRAGLVDEDSPEDDARVKLYRLRPEPIGELRTWLEEVEAFWGDQLEAFARHAESRVRKGKGKR